MDTDDSINTKNIYEVAEFQEFDDNKGLFPDSSKYKPVYTTGKVPVIIIIALLVIILFFVGVILGLTAATYLQTNTTNRDNDNPTNNSPLTSMEQLTCNCSMDNKYMDDVARNNSLLQSQINQLNVLLMTQANRILNTTQGTATQIQQTAWKIDDIQEYTDTQMSYTLNNTYMLDQIYQTTQSTTTKLNNIVGTLSNIKDTSNSNAGIVNDILGVVEELLELQNGSIIFNSLKPVSCQDIKAALPNSPSGYYHVNSRNIYCNMDELCGSGGGWTRIAYLDMSDAAQNCPSTWDLFVSGSVRACTRKYSTTSSCSSVAYSTNGISYTEICGQVMGYQWGHTDAISPANQGHGLESFYVDGISVTRGSPRQHVWTFMSALFENQNNPWDTCPCYPNSNINVPSFVGTDYYCESGNPNSYYQEKFYANEILWDGSCTTFEQPCCTNQPWFHKVLSSNTTDSIELRNCGNEATFNEHNPIVLYEIYVK